MNYDDARYRVSRLSDAFLSELEILKLSKAELNLVNADRELRRSCWDHRSIEKRVNHGGYYGYVKGENEEMDASRERLFAASTWQLTAESDLLQMMENELN